MGHSPHQPGPVAMITGTSSGFGLLTAIALAKAGYRVVATMRDLARSGGLLEAARRDGVEPMIECRQLDVTDHSTIRQTVERVIETHNQIDLLVNNAGFAVGGFVEEIPLTEWSRQLETNVFGLIAVTKAVLPHMRARRQGKIVNISSVSGLFGFPGYAPYATSKFAVEGFSEALRLEMLPFGIHVVLVEPGAYKTDIWAKGFDQIETAADSPYREKLEAVLSYSRQTAAAAADPAEVAAQVVAIARSPYPKLRYPLGKGARMLIWLKAILPWKWIEQAVVKKLG